MIFDVEADGLLEDATKIHCMSWSGDNGVTIKTTHDEKLIRQVLKHQKVLIGHNIIRYDVPLIEKILGIKIKAKLYDTLPMSWVQNEMCLYCRRKWMET